MSTKIYVLKDPRIEGRESIFYVGKTAKLLNERLNLHICNAKDEKYVDYFSYKAALIRSILQDNLVPIIKMIENVTHDEWAQREIYWIQKMNDIGCPLLNAHPGGGSGPPVGQPRSKFIVDRIAKALKGHAVSDETRRKISEAVMGRPAWNKGRAWDEETKRKISEKNKGKILPLEQREKISKGLKALGRKMSEYNKQKIRERNYKFTDEDKKTISAAQKERFRKNPKPSHKHSEETKKKISEAHKKFRQNNPPRVMSEESRRKLSASKTEYYRKLREQKAQNEIS